MATPTLFGTNSEAVGVGLSPSTPYNITHTFPSGGSGTTAIIVLTQGYINAAWEYQSLTWNGVSLTKIGEYSFTGDGSNDQVFAYALVNPTPATNGTLAITMPATPNGTSTHNFLVLNVQDLDPTTQFGAVYGVMNSTSSTLDLTIATESGDAALGVFGAWDGGEPNQNTVSIDTGTQIAAHNDTGGNINDAVFGRAVASGTTTTITAGNRVSGSLNTCSWWGLGFALKQSPAGATTAVPVSSETITEFAPVVHNVGSGYFALEDGTGRWQLEDGTGYFELEAGTPTASGVTIAVPLKAITVSKHVPLAVTPRVIAAPVKSVTVAELVPSVPRITQVPLKTVTVNKLVPLAVTPRIIAAPVKSVTVAGYAPTLSAPTVIAVPLLSVAVAKLVPEIKTPRRIVPNKELQVSVAYNEPAIVTPRVIAVPVYSRTVAKLAPTVVTPRVVAVPVKSVSVSALTPTMITPRVVGVPLHSATVNKLAPEVKTPRVIPVPVRNVVVNAFAPSIGQNITIAVPLYSSQFTAHAPLAITPRRVNVPVKSTVVTSNAPTVIVSQNTVVTVPLKQVTVAKFVPVFASGRLVQVPLKSIDLVYPVPNIVGGAAGVIDGSLTKTINVNFGFRQLYNMNGTGSYGTISSG